MNTIAMQPCDSSNVAAWGYSPATKTLAVQFRSGATYHYTGVPADVVDQMRQPDVPIGSFISKNIRGVFTGELQKAPVTEDE